MSINPKPVLYIYLDDGDGEESVAFANAIQTVTPGLEINHEYPSDFSQQIKLFRGRSFTADGIILDLRLDQLAHEVDGNKQQADYRAPALAQEIRTRAAEKRYKEFPIVLMSFDRRLRESYRKDNTSHDLFDMIVVKEELQDDFAQEVGRKLISLAKGYETIVAIRDSEKRRVDWFYRLLGFQHIEDASFLDPRLLGHFNSYEIKHPAHDYARFIIRHLLDRPGPLIGRGILAARLGLDLAASPDSEKLFNEYFDTAKYKGAFHEGWHCWWAFKIEEIWNQSNSGAKPLRTLKAEERVNYLKAVTGFRNLGAAAPLRPNHSTRYWTICRELDVPLDPKDGLLLNINKPFPWQIEQFVSFEAYKDRLITRRDIDPIDYGRLEMMKEQEAS